ncbi:MAG: hypothetical protein HQK54_11610 [Oligoflexales bacterium]|nr:hypothetical protein [Oligoflexales bacterium]
MRRVELEKELKPMLKMDLNGNFAEICLCLFAVILIPVSPGCGGDDRESLRGLTPSPADADQVKGRTEERGKLRFYVYHGDFARDFKARYERNGSIGAGEQSDSLLSGSVDPIDDINQQGPPDHSPDLRWPSAPRVILQSSITMQNDLSLHLGIEQSMSPDGAEKAAGGIIILNASAVNTTSFLLSSDRELFLIKEDDQSEILKEVKENGRSVIRPNVEKGKMMVGICTHVILSEVSNRSKASLQIAGNGYSGSTDISEKVKLTLYSNYFGIDEADTLDGLKAYCRQSYSEEVKETAAKDFVSTLSGTFTLTDGQKTPTAEQIAVNSALFGPDRKKLKYGGHKFNIYKARVDVKSGKSVAVKGRFHAAVDIPIVGNHEVQYSCRMENVDPSALSLDAVNPQVDSMNSYAKLYGYMNAARSLARLICHDAYVEFYDAADGTY